MKLRDLGEFGLIERIERAARRSRAAGRIRSPRGLVVGIGDDGAVLRPPAGEDWVVTTDALVEGVHTIFHLAALIAIPYSYVAPDSYIDTNVKGTLNICQAARKHGARRVVITSTSEVYGTAQYVPIDEKHPLQPQSPYSASKIGADHLALSFHMAFGLPVVIARPFNGCRHRIV